MQPSIDAASLLREHGVRVTAQRLAVLRAVSGRPHATCGRMVDVDYAVGVTPCLTAADESDYEIDETEGVYWGGCPECLEAAPVSAGD